MLAFELFKFANFKPQQAVFSNGFCHFFILFDFHDEKEENAVIKSEVEGKRRKVSTEELIYMIRTG